MIEDYGIELMQMMENAGSALAPLARVRFFNGDPRGKRVVISFVYVLWPGYIHRRDPRAYDAGDGDADPGFAEGGAAGAWRSVSHG